MCFNSSTTNTTAAPSAEQRAMMGAQTDFFTNTLAPTYQQVTSGAQNLYNQNAGGVLNAAQNLAQIGSQAQNTLGSTGESALRTGITGLESLFNPGYEANQIQAALAPAQAQYLQNQQQVANMWGGAGQAGGARAAMAQQGLAGQTQAAQMMAAANIQQQIAAQRAGAANQLAQQGASNIGQALGAANQQVSASQNPMQNFAQYASIPMGMPAAAYTPNFQGTQGSTVNKQGFDLNFGLKLPGM